MKIVREGTPRDRTLVGDCRDCRCRVECCPGEAEWMNGDRPFDAGCYYVACPTPGCGSTIYLKAKDG